MTIDVIRLAYEANIDLEHHVSISRDPVWIATQDELERFAALVAVEVTEEANRKANAGWALMCKKMVEAEREECAKVCEEAAERSAVSRGMSKTIKAHDVYSAAESRSLWLAAAIRARKP